MKHVSRKAIAAVLTVAVAGLAVAAATAGVSHKNAAIQACASGSFSAGGINTPIRRIRSGCCAHAGSGATSVAPPKQVMNSRRFN